MKLYRYMSIEEFIKMSSGLDMKPYCVDFGKFGAKTNSEGFCFLGETITTESGQIISPEEMLSYGFQGIVSQDVLVEFETTEDIAVKERIWNIC